MPLYSPEDIAVELEAQLDKTDLGVSNALVHIDQPNLLVFRLDNGQEFAAEITRWGGPRA